jgi:hypothetical protein
MQSNLELEFLYQINHSRLNWNIFLKLLVSSRILKFDLAFESLLTLWLDWQLANILGNCEVCD